MRSETAAREGGSHARDRRGRPIVSGVRFSRVLSRRAILAGAALALLAGPSAAPLAHAAAPSPMELMARAVSRAHSLTMTIVQKTTGPAASGGGMSTTMQEVAVRQGKTF